MHIFTPVSLQAQARGSSFRSAPSLIFLVTLFPPRPLPPPRHRCARCTARAAGRTPKSSLHGENQQIAEQKFVWQHANKSRSVGPSGWATKPEQNAIVFADTVDLSRGGTMHVLGPQERNVSNPVPNEEPREVASLCILKYPTVDQCMLASSNISASLVKTSQRCWTSGFVQSPCETSPWEPALHLALPATHAPRTVVTHVVFAHLRLPPSFLQHAAALPLSPLRHHSVSSHCDSSPLPRLPTRSVDASPP